MILTELREYLRQHGRVTLNQLVVHFHSDGDAMRGMLKVWISKGKLRQVSTPASCGTSCCKCDPMLTEIYEWQE